MDLLHIIWSSILILLTLILFYNVGNFSLKFFNFEKSAFSFPLGMIIILAIFHILALPSCILLSSYNYIIYFVAPLFLVALIFSTYYFFRYEIKNLGSRYTSKFNIFVDIISVLYGIYLFIFSVPFCDSTIYLPLTQISSISGYVYSQDGITPYTSVAHQFDTYYLFQSMLTTLSNTDVFLFTSTFFKFLEGFIVVQSVAFFFDVITTKYKKTGFTIGFLGILLWISVFTNSLWSGNPDYSYTPIFLVHMGPTGTILMYIILIPILLIYATKYESIKNNALFLTVISLFGMSISSSSLGIIGIFLITMIIYEVIFARKKLNFSFYIPTMFILATELYLIAIFYNNWNYSNLLIYEIIISLLFIILYYLCKKKVFSTFMYVAAIAGFILALLLLFYIKGYDPTEHLFYKFTYTSVSLFIGIGIIALHSENKKLFYFMMLNYLIFSTSILKFFFHSTDIAPVYHRIEMIPSIYLFCIFGCCYFIHYFAKGRISKFVFICIIVLFGIHQNIGVPNPTSKLTKFNISSFEEYNSLTEYKIRDQEAYEISKYDFEEGATFERISYNEDLPTSLSAIFYLNPELELVYVCEENCYHIESVEYKPEKGEKVVFETKNYKLIYMK